MDKSNLETKQHLMLSTLSLIADKGYDNVTIDHIAEATGNTKGAVYHYFNSKKQLYKASLEFLSETLSLQNVIGKFENTDLKSNLRSVLMKAAELESLADQEGILRAQDIYYLYFDGIRRFPDLKDLLEAQRIAYIENTVKAIGHLNGQVLTQESVRKMSIRFLVAVEGLALLQATAKSFVDEDDVEDILSSVLKDL